jgi:hypothetical protein
MKPSGKIRENQCRKKRDGSEPGGYLSQLFFTGRAEHLLLPVELVERVGPEHDALGILAVAKAQQVPDLVGAFLCDPVDQVIVPVLPPVVLVAEPGGRDNRGTDLLPGKAEDEIVPVPVQVLVDDKEDRLIDPVPVLVGLDAVEQRPGIDLVACVIVPHHPDRVLRHFGTDTEDRRYDSFDRLLEAGG